MSQNTGRKVTAVSLAALFLVNFAYMADMAIIPAANSIYTQFSEAPAWLLNFILTGPQLIGVLSAVAMPFAMRKYSKRTIILTLFSVFTAVACCGALVINVWYIAVMRAVSGFASGGLAPVALALINELYHDDENKCNMLVGVFNSVTAAAGAVMSIIAGVLCTVHWTHVYYEYFAAIPMLILLFLFVPRTEPEQRPHSGQTAAEKRERLPLGRVCALIGSLLVIGILFNMMSYENSMYVSQTRLGNSVLAGVISSVITLATAIGCILTAPIYAKLKRGLAPVIYALLAVGYLGCRLVLGKAWLILCCSLLGFGYGIAMSYFYIYAAAVVPSSRVSQIIGYIAAANGLGAFLCSYVSSGWMQLLRIEKLTDLCLLYAAILGVGSVLSVYLAIRCKRRNLEQNPA
ncbi:MAG: MFS transporter [Oscillibacter sp.]|jgi:MFS family permease|nr:MFS transporter [Oscillibacter sp.]